MNKSMKKQLTDTQHKVYTYVLAKFRDGKPMPYSLIAEKVGLSRETVRRAVISLKLIKRKNGRIVGVK
mgnify:CR=1 FL=1